MKTNATYSIQHFADITGGIVTGEACHEVRYFATDSRSLPGTDGVMFIAIRGKHHDGNRYTGEVYRRGIRSFMVNDMPDTGEFPGAAFLVVKDSMAALQKIAGWKRQQFGGTVISITGSNGKTIVKEWLYQLMSRNTHIVRSPRSFNSQLGVPLSLWQLSEQYAYGIIEAGISTSGEMERLEKMIAPDLGILTNIGTAHREGFSSDSEKLREKLKLFRSCRKLIYRTDLWVDGIPVDEFLRDYSGSRCGWTLIQDTAESITEHTKYKFIRQSASDRLTLESASERQTFHLPFADAASVENICHVIVCMLETGCDPDKLSEQVSSLEPVEMRLQILKGVHGSTIVSDVYNADLAGLDRALDVLQQQERHRKKAVIISDMHQSGMEPANLYAEVAKQLEFREVDMVFGIGGDISRFGKQFSMPSSFFPDVSSFLNAFNPTVLNDAAVLIKGARAYRFEGITRELQLQFHKTVLEIDISALVDNLNYFRSLLSEKTAIMVMVKALAYGSGASEIAAILQHQKVDYLAVAYPDEGVKLRTAGITMPVMVMNSDPSEYQQIIDYRLEPELFSREGFEQFISACEFAGERQYPVHLKLDTGMHRLGFEPGDLPWIKERSKQSEVRVISVFSHLVASDDENFDDFTRSQIDLFRRFSGEIIRELGYPVKRHILNSAGIVRFSGAQMEMVRLGIGLYGAGAGEQLKTVSTFRTVISQVRNIKAGETVGYARMGKIDRDAVIATIPVGYADGIDRKLGNGHIAFTVNGRKAPTVGNICMDMTMIDITGIDATVGDQVELFGKVCNVESWAKELDTIVYEIFTGIPERVKRVYIRE